jgi:truncated hemoglobin YjbI
VGLLASLCGALGGASHLRERVGHERSTENQGPSFMAEVLPYGPTRWLPCFSKSAR